MGFPDALRSRREATTFTFSIKLTRSIPVHTLRPTFNPPFLPFHGFRSAPMSDDYWDTRTALRTTHSYENLSFYSQTVRSFYRDLDRGSGWISIFPRSLTHCFHLNFCPPEIHFYVTVQDWIWAVSFMYSAVHASSEPRNWVTGPFHIRMCCRAHCVGHEWMCIAHSSRKWACSLVRPSTAYTWTRGFPGFLSSKPFGRQESWHFRWTYVNRLALLSNFPRLYE